MPTTRANTTNTNKSNAAGKRVLSPEQLTPNISKSKKSKTSTMSANEFQELKNMLGLLSSSLGQKIDDSRSALENKFICLDNKFSELATQVNSDVKAIKDSVVQFEKKITQDIDSMSSMLKNHSDRLDNNDDDIQRVQLSQDLRLAGFAVKENENLMEIFRKVADEIGFAVGDNIAMPTIERMPAKNHVTGQMMLSPTIIIHFSSIRQKQSFYSLYLNKMPLKPEKFGMTCDSRIVVGEHLTRKNAQLFKSAQILRKNEKIAQTFTENGIVKIRFAKGKNEKTFTVRNQTELESIVAQYGTAHALNGQRLSNPAPNASHANNTNHTANNNNTQQQQQQQQENVSDHNRTRQNYEQQPTNANLNGLNQSHSPMETQTELNK